MLSNGAKEGQSRSQFLMDSADKVAFFIEKDAVNPETGIHTYGYYFFFILIFEFV